jgi:hypothetical protein
MFEIDRRELPADDGGHIEGLVLVKSTLKLKWLFVDPGALDGCGLAYRSGSLDSGSGHQWLLWIVESLTTSSRSWRLCQSQQVRDVKDDFAELQRNAIVIDMNSSEQQIASLYVERLRGAELKELNCVLAQPT